jgi:hypothetical protein
MLQYYHEAQESEGGSAEAAQDLDGVPGSAGDAGKADARASGVGEGWPRMKRMIGYRWGRWTLMAGLKLRHDADSVLEVDAGEAKTAKLALREVERVARTCSWAMRSDLADLAAAIVEVLELRGCDGRCSPKPETPATPARFKQGAHLRRLPGRVG